MAGMLPDPERLERGAVGDRVEHHKYEIRSDYNVQEQQNFLKDVIAPDPKTTPLWRYKDFDN